MGTVLHRTPGLHETILAALRDEPVNLLIALGFDQDPARLALLPPHVRVQPTLPQVALLPRCALLVSHGGFNSVKEALAEGVPLVIVPVAGDQHYCAKRCQALGVGRVIGPAERNAAAIRQPGGWCCAIPPTASRHGTCATKPARSRRPPPPLPRSSRSLIRTRGTGAALLDLDGARRRHQRCGANPSARSLKRRIYESPLAPRLGQMTADQPVAIKRRDPRHRT